MSDDEKYRLVKDDDGGFTLEDVVGWRSMIIGGVTLGVRIEFENGSGVQFALSPTDALVLAEELDRKARKALTPPDTKPQ